MIANDSKERLLRQLQAYDFALYDTILYLDAYPNCKEAIMAYNKYSRLAKRTRDEYESKYGPLTFPQECTDWKWVNAPWPWQNMRGDR